MQLYFPSAFCIQNARRRSATSAWLHHTEDLYKLMPCAQGGNSIRCWCATQKRSHLLRFLKRVVVHLPPQWRPHTVSHTVQVRTHWPDSTRVVWRRRTGSRGFGGPINQLVGSEVRCWKGVSQCQDEADLIWDVRGHFLAVQRFTFFPNREHFILEQTAQVVFAATLTNMLFKGLLFVSLACSLLNDLTLPSLPIASSWENYNLKAFSFSFFFFT